MYMYDTLQLGEWCPRKKGQGDYLKIIPRRDMGMQLFHFLEIL